MNWLHWALLSGLFADLMTALAKAGVKGIVQSGHDHPHDRDFGFRLEHCVLPRV
ncbi:MAG TPA: hypothetical protein VNN22_06235 [Verrucomicrobiae bacterium]|nr:hypothetical protein [Verrucomicrobiae bacterium]